MDKEVFGEVRKTLLVRYGLKKQVFTERPAQNTGRFFMLIHVAGIVDPAVYIP
jgi:hypothetical protein